MLAHGTAGQVVKSGGDTWFFLTADYAFGQALERDATSAVLANGGKVVGGVRHPLNTQDFSSFLLQRSSPKPRSLVLRMPVATPSTRSNRVPSSGLRQADNALLGC
jgi:branched-chain amino acid transport system substrate-binding protein